MTESDHQRYLICLTGNIATGKSTVAAILAELGATIIDADKVVHKLMQKGNTLYEPVVGAFGRHIVGDDGEIQRSRLGQIVFSDPTELRRLEEIVHPATSREVQRRAAEAKTAVVVIEAIKLIEAGWHHSCQALWVTTCSEKQQIERLMADRSLTLDEARLRVTAQPPQSQKVNLADIVIDTSGEISETHRQISAAWEALGVGGTNGPISAIHGCTS